MTLTLPEQARVTDLPRGPEREIGFSVSGVTVDDVVVSVLPDEERSLALLVSFRPFVLENEPIQLSVMYNLAIESIRCVRSQNILRASRTRWKRLRDDWPAVFYSKGTKIRAHKGLRLWMYGYVFHSDPDSFNLLDDMTPGMRDALKVQALLYILATTREISRVRRLLERAIRKNLLIEMPALKPAIIPQPGPSPAA